MTRIHVLDDTTINKIAAGEVVEPLVGVIVSTENALAGIDRKHRAPTSTKVS